MLIQNYGLFWRRDWIFFGSGPKPGHLKGVRAKAVMDDPVDFSEQQGVYCLYDDGFRLVYVGQSGQGNQRLLDRLRQHRADAVSDRWTKFSWFGVRWVKQNNELSAERSAANPEIGDVLDHIEAILIAAAEPVHNKFSGPFGGNVERYLQWRDDENLGVDTHQMIREMYKYFKSNIK